MLNLNGHVVKRPWLISFENAFSCTFLLLSSNIFNPLNDWSPLNGQTHLKQNCQWKLQVCLNMHDLLVDCCTLKSSGVFILVYNLSQHWLQLLKLAWKGWKKCKSIKRPNINLPKNTGALVKIQDAKIRALFK